MNEKYSDKIDFSKLEQNQVYRALIPYTPNRPLKCVYYNIKTEKKPFNIENYYDKNGVAKVLNVIVPHKSRPVIIFQNNKYNKDTDYEYIYVLPIFRLHRERKTKEEIDDIINNINPFTVYLGELTGIEAYVNISDLKRISKSFLIDKFDGIDEIPEDLIEDIVNKLIDMFGLDFS